MDNIVDVYLQRFMRVIRVSEGEASNSAKLIDKANEKIVELFEKTFTKKTVTRKDVNALLIKTNDLINLTYNQELRFKALKDIKDLIDMEYEWNKGVFQKLGFGDRVVDFDQELLIRNSIARPYKGKTFAQWLNVEGTVHASKVDKVLRAGISSQASTETIVKSLTDLTTTPKHHIRTLTRSAILASSNDTKEAFFEENSELMDGKQWLSTLDVRTTPMICGVRDGKKYSNENQPIGHDHPWNEGPGRIHFNCRSTWVPLIDGFSITAPRSAVGAGDEYESGDKYTRTGKVRKPTKPNRNNGIFEIEQVGPRAAYEGWLRRQPMAFVTDAFNNNDEIARLFKKGASLDSLMQNVYGSSLNMASL